MRGAKTIEGAKGLSNAARQKREQLTCFSKLDSLTVSTRDAVAAAANDCRLYVAPMEPPLLPAAYSIAVQRNSPLKDPINSAYVGGRGSFDE